MRQRITPNSLAAELGVSASIVRRWLREHVDRAGETGPWLIDDDLAARVRAHFASTAAVRAGRPAVCTADECDRAAVARGLCRMHYNRWDRHGSTEKLDGADHQRAKTHCPYGHPYNEDNTIVYPSDGRRRCRACRRGAGE
ncbi:hypothetical protein JN535_04765 [Cellulosimicrobium cellulans]|uniref:hypothetical protein n=1 Tax=Cellulosimicrobium cellulans TaxID=1710 RepID=UPI001964BB55|nr:hypothetical protein [Cellulosimicrobium cellulans]MBN0039487.1 hypothetical protein [Cellulosimicrobium cellulans]